MPLEDDALSAAKLVEHERPAAECLLAQALGRERLAELLNHLGRHDGPGGIGQLPEGGHERLAHLERECVRVGCQQRRSKRRRIRIQCAGDSERETLVGGRDRRAAADEALLAVFGRHLDALGKVVEDRRLSGRRPGVEIAVEKQIDVDAREVDMRVYSKDVQQATVCDTPSRDGVALNAVERSRRGVRPPAVPSAATTNDSRRCRAQRSRCARTQERSPADASAVQTRPVIGFFQASLPWGRNGAHPYQRTIRRRYDTYSQTGCGLSTAFDLSGGGGGIRTHEGLATPAVFKTAAFNRSATPPQYDSSPFSAKRASQLLTDC